MAKQAPTPSTETLEPRIYEIGYLLSPAVRDEDLGTRVDELKESLMNLGATFISEGAPEFIDLAYEMMRVIDNKNVRFNQGYFGWIKINLNPARMAELKELLDTHKLIIRSLLIKTVAENTIVGKRSLGKILKGERTSDEVASESGEVPEIAETPAAEVVEVEEPAVEAPIEE